MITHAEQCTGRVGPILGNIFSLWTFSQLSMRHPSISHAALAAFTSARTDKEAVSDWAKRSAAHRVIQADFAVCNADRKQKVFNVHSKITVSKDAALSVGAFASATGAAWLIYLWDMLHCEECSRLYRISDCPKLVQLSVLLRGAGSQ